MKIIKKWWFWLMLLIIICIIAFVVIMALAFGTIKEETGNLALEIQDIYDKATLYSSAGKNTLILELDNWDNENNNDKLPKIQNAIKNRVNNNELQTYSKLIILTFLNVDDKENLLFMKHVYNIPEFTEESKVEYIDFQYINSNTNFNTSNTTSIDAQEKGEDITLTAGKYEVGIDIKAGKYDAIAQSGHGNLFVKGTSYVNETLGTTDSSFYIPSYNNITLKNGDTVEVNGSLKVLFQAK